MSRHPIDAGDDLVEACDVEPNQSVTIVGTRHIDLLAALCRRGFVRAACRRADAAPQEPADVLILPDCVGETDLRKTLARFGRAMGKGGRIVLRLTPHLPFSRALHNLLAAHGFQLTPRSRRLADGSILRFAHKYRALDHAYAA
jgi:hypothetical protein